MFSYVHFYLLINNYDGIAAVYMYYMVFVFCLILLVIYSKRREHFNYLKCTKIHRYTHTRMINSVKPLVTNSFDDDNLNKCGQLKKHFRKQ